LNNSPKFLIKKALQKSPISKKDGRRIFSFELWNSINGCHTPFYPQKDNVFYGLLWVKEFFQLKWHFWSRNYFIVQSRHLEFDFWVFQVTFYLNPYSKEDLTLLLLVCENKVRVRNSVDRGEGVRHSPSPVVLARSLYWL